MSEEKCHSCTHLDKLITEYPCSECMHASKLDLWEPVEDKEVMLDGN